MASHREPLVFQGAPRALVAALPGGWDPRGGVPTLELEAPLPEPPRVQRVRLRAGQGHGLRITVPPVVPPGRYTGEITAGSSKHAVLVDVPADPRLRIAPVEPEVTVDAGGQAQLNLTAFNTGNVEQEIPQHPSVTFSGPAEAPSTVYDVKIPGLDRFAAITARLQRAEDPVAGVEVTDGVGTLAAGESRELTLTVHAEAGLAPGARYIGAWTVPGDTVAIGLTVGGGAIEEEVT